MCYQNLIILFSDKATLEETERTLYALKKLASNPECVTSLVERLANYIRIILTATNNTECRSVEKAISELLSQILQVKLSEICTDNKIDPWSPLVKKVVDSRLLLCVGKWSKKFV